METDRILGGDDAAVGSSFENGGGGGMMRVSTIGDFRSQDAVTETYASLRVIELPADDDSDVVPLHETFSPADMTSTFYHDVRTFAPGSMPHSAVVGTTIGVFCGVVAYLYYTALEFFLEFLWLKLPSFVIEPYLDPSWYFLWIPFLGFLMAFGVGASVKILGEPGDLSYTVQCVHDKAFIGMDHVLPMLAASQFSILGGGSLGPEAPLVAICASFSGWISRKVFRQTRMNLIRKHTLMVRKELFDTCMLQLQLLGPCEPTQHRSLNNFFVLLLLLSFRVWHVHWQHSLGCH